MMSFPFGRTANVTWLEAPLEQVWKSVVTADGSNSYLTDRVETSGSRDEPAQGDLYTLYYGDIINRARVVEVQPFQLFVLSDSYESMNPDGSVQPFDVTTSYYFAEEAEFTKLTIEVAGFSNDTFGQWFRECLEMGWRRSLMNLKSVLELGMDLRAEMFSYPRLGVNNCTVNREQSRKTGVSEKEGNYLLDVFPNSPAERAGLQSGDVIVQIGRENVPDYAQFVRVISAWYGRNKPLPLVYVRKGKRWATTADLSIESMFTGLIDPHQSSFEKERERRKILAAQRSAAGTMWKEGLARDISDEE